MESGINWGSRILDALSLFISFVLSVSIISVHKFLYVSLGFQAGTFLMSLNFITTFLLCLLICLIAHYYDFENYKFKWLPWMEVFKMSLSSAGSAVFGNLSLIYNSVGFFQISKILQVPFQIIIEYFVYGKTTSLETIFVLTFLLTGVALVAVHDVSLNIIGCIFSLLTSLSTALALVAVPNKSKELGASSFQILTCNSIVIAFLILIPVPIFDRFDTINFSSTLLTVIPLSCLCASNLNIATYTVLERTSPLTYVKILLTFSHLVSGQLKTVFLIVMADYYTKRNLEIGYIVGIFLSVISSVWYAHVRMKEKRIEVVVIHDEEKKNQE